LNTLRDANFTERMEHPRLSEFGECLTSKQTVTNRRIGADASQNCKNG